MVGACHTEKGFDRTKTSGLKPKRESCATCRFWLPAAVEPETPETDELTFGFCRRRPPQIVETLARMVVGKPVIGGGGEDMEALFSITEAYNATSFPSTFTTEWCGEFEWLPRLQPKEWPIC